MYLDSIFFFFWEKENTSRMEEHRVMEKQEKQPPLPLTEQGAWSRTGSQDPIPGPADHNWSWRQRANQLNDPGTPQQYFLNNGKSKHIVIFNGYLSGIILLTNNSCPEGIKSEKYLVLQKVHKGNYPLPISTCNSRLCAFRPRTPC